MLASSLTRHLLELVPLHSSFWTESTEGAAAKSEWVTDLVENPTTFEIKIGEATDQTPPHHDKN